MLCVDFDSVSRTVQTLSCWEVDIMIRFGSDFLLKAERLACKATTADGPLGSMVHKMMAMFRAGLLLAFGIISVLV